MGSIRFTIPMSLYKFVFVCLILHIEVKDLVVNKAARMVLYSKQKCLLNGTNLKDFIQVLICCT